MRIENVLQFDKYFDCPSNKEKIKNFKINQNPCDWKYSILKLIHFSSITAVVGMAFINLRDDQFTDPLINDRIIVVRKSIILALATSALFLVKKIPTDKKIYRSFRIDHPNEKKIVCTLCDFFPKEGQNEKSAVQSKLSSRFDVWTFNIVRVFHSLAITNLAIVLLNHESSNDHSDNSIDENLTSLKICSCLTVISFSILSLLTHQFPIPISKNYVVFDKGNHQQEIVPSHFLSQDVEVVDVVEDRLFKD